MYIKMARALEFDFPTTFALSPEHTLPLQIKDGKKAKSTSSDTTIPLHKEAISPPEIPLKNNSNEYFTTSNTKLKYIKESLPKIANPNISMENGDCEENALPIQKSNLQILLIKNIKFNQPELIEKLANALSIKNTICSKEPLTQDGLTAEHISELLHVAIDTKDMSDIAMLLQCGADLTQRHNGINALGKAIQTGDPNIVIFIINELLKQNKNYFNEVISENTYILDLHLAINKNKHQIVNILLYYGANPTQKYDGKDALDQCIENENIPIIKALSNEKIIRSEKYFFPAGKMIDKIRQAIRNRKYEVAQEMRHSLASRLFPKFLVWFGELFIWFWSRPIFGFGKKTT